MADEPKKRGRKPKDELSKDVLNAMRDMVASIEKPKVPPKVKPQIQNTSRLADQAISKALRIPGGRTIIRQPAVREKAFAKFEKLTGGREELFDILELAPAHDYKAITLLVNDPNAPNMTLSELCSTHKVGLGALVHAYKEAKAISIQLESVAKLEQYMPAITEQIAEDAQNLWVPCKECDAVGRVPCIEGGEFARHEDGTLITQVCHACRGKKRIFQQHDFKNRDAVLKIVGLAQPKEPLIQQTFDQRKQSIALQFTPGGGAFEHLMKATDKVLYNITPEEENDPEQ